MIDKMIRPIYDDIYLGTFKGDAVDVKGKPLNKALSRGWLDELMEHGREYSSAELRELVFEAHRDAGGADSESNEPSRHITKALQSLKEVGVITMTRYGFWERLPENDAALLPSKHEAETNARPTAEIDIGEGAETVYAWYLPVYRERARLTGQPRFPMKIGRTGGEADDRAHAHVGTAPEKPAVGFALHVDDSVAWEKFLHGKLATLGRHVADAVGDEWYFTTPEELQGFAEAQLAAANAEDK